MFKASLQEFKSTKSLTAMAMLMALTIILGYYTIQIGDFLKVGFSSIPHQIVSIMFGPAVGGIFGAAADIIKYIIKPTGAFFPGFTISGIVSGVIYGVVMYKKPLNLVRIAVANVITTVVVNLLMNTYWLTILYGKGFMMILPGRLIKEVVMCGISIVLMYIITTSLKPFFQNK